MSINAHDACPQVRQAQHMYSLVYNTSGAVFFPDTPTLKLLLLLLSHKPPACL